MQEVVVLVCFHCCDWYIWQQQFRGGKVWFGWWFQRFSLWSANSITLGLRGGRTSWWKGMVKENCSIHDNLEEVGRERKGGREKDARKKNINSKGMSSWPTSSRCTIASYSYHSVNPLNGLIHWLMYGPCYLFISPPNIPAFLHVNSCWTPHIQTITVTLSQFFKKRSCLVIRAHSIYFASAVESMYAVEKREHLTCMEPKTGLWKIPLNILHINL